MLSKRDQNKREKLRLKMCELQDEASKYEKKIRVIDANADETQKEKRQQLLGKCFALRTSKLDTDVLGYLRIE